MLKLLNLVVDVEVLVFCGGLLSSTGSVSTELDESTEGWDVSKTFGLINEFIVCDSKSIVWKWWAVAV